jgi:hypothetical protein
MIKSSFTRHTAYIRAYIIKLFNHTFELAKTIAMVFPIFYPV